MVGKLDSFCHSWKQKCLKDFDSWGQKGHWAVAGSFVSRFARFQQRYDFASLPDVGDD